MIQLLQIENDIDTIELIKCSDPYTSFVVNDTDKATFPNTRYK